jgi:hypothetical protein
MLIKVNERPTRRGVELVLRDKQHANAGIAKDDRPSGGKA